MVQMDRPVPADGRAGIRTQDLPLKRRLLYRAELRDRAKSNPEVYSIPAKNARLGLLTKWMGKSAYDT